jgi:hypothetical protein
MDKQGHEKISEALEGLEGVGVTPIPPEDGNEQFVTIEYSGATTPGMVLSALYRAKLLRRVGPRAREGMWADLELEEGLSFPGSLTFEDRRPRGGYVG